MVRYILLILPNGGDLEFFGVYWTSGPSPQKSWEWVPTAWSGKDLNGATAFPHSLIYVSTGSRCAVLGRRPPFRGPLLLFAVELLPLPRQVGLPDRGCRGLAGTQEFVAAARAEEVDRTGGGCGG